MTGDFFGEPYAATPGSVLNISVVAAEDCNILMLEVRRLLSACSSSCEHHQRLIRNMVSVLSNKILIFNDKREKLMSFLSSESFRQGKLSFDIPYD